MSNMLKGRSATLFNNEVLGQFFEPAEEDYLAARLLFNNRLTSSFVWTAGQCLEKYLKAALLFRQKQVRKKHLLVWHYRSLRKSGDYSFPELMKRKKGAYRYPVQIDENGEFYHLEYTEKTESFLQRFDLMYDPDQRYGRIDHDLELYDLFKFDQLVGHLRSAALTALGAPRDFSVNEKNFGRIDLRNLSLEVATSLRTANYVFFEDEAWDPEERPLPWYSVANRTSRSKVYELDGDYRKAVSTLNALITG